MKKYMTESDWFNEKNFKLRSSRMFAYCVNGHVVRRKGTKYSCHDLPEVCNTCEASKPFYYADELQI